MFTGTSCSSSISQTATHILFKPQVLGSEADRCASPGAKDAPDDIAMLQDVLTFTARPLTQLCKGATIYGSCSLPQQTAVCRDTAERSGRGWCHNHGVMRLTAATCQHGPKPHARAAG